MSIALTALEPGQAAVICGYADDDPQTQQRFMTMGLLEGSEVELLRIAPAGDPIEVRIMGYALSLRKQDAAVILVETDGST